MINPTGTSVIPVKQHWKHDYIDISPILYAVKFSYYCINEMLSDLIMWVKIYLHVLQ
jgi:hypothetical protein